MERGSGSSQYTCLVCNALCNSLAEYRYICRCPLNQCICRPCCKSHSISYTDARLRFGPEHCVQDADGPGPIAMSLALVLGLVGGEEGREIREAMEWDKRPIVTDQYASLIEWAEQHKTGCVKRETLYTTDKAYPPRHYDLLLTCKVERLCDTTATLDVVLKFNGTPVHLPNDKEVFVGIPTTAICYTALELDPPPSPSTYRLMTTHITLTKGVRGLAGALNIEGGVDVVWKLRDGHHCRDARFEDQDTVCMHVQSSMVGFTTSDEIYL